eukprot:CAMPEP_0196132790 /NCGR_PEP_ID=MMETSP0910-20130528/2269_1 /TAXON_ID=49265 /ORGANISM="Thalassiosira rotula, Strain GSO102" /LENGTH=279 /DNA_ID=CAMNT_0041392431 /DNA_START=240 /DNA_END=1076 /DNA_ORIENTATION=+
MVVLLSTTSSHYNINISTSSSFSTVLAFVANHDYYRPPPPPSSSSRQSSPLQSRASSCLLRMSSVGGEDNNNEDDDDNNPLNEWISRKESKNVRQVREQFAEGRLPISYGAMNTDDDDDDDSTNNNNPQQGNNGTFGPLKDETQSPTDDAIDATTSTSLSRNTNNNKPNPYLNVVSRLAPSDLIAKFTSTASPRVQDAVRTTVLGLIGGLPQMAFETKTVATGERLASLMFQLQMTGYMFKNAEYRLSLAQSLGGSVDSRMFLPGGRDEEEEDAKAVRE